MTSIPTATTADGVELAYVDHGSGECVVLVHGSLADLSYWQQSRQLELLGAHYRVIA
jgi:pimeloyl-ACP methyl ester carboxylesterase